MGAASMHHRRSRWQCPTVAWAGTSTHDTCSRYESCCSCFHAFLGKAKLLSVFLVAVINVSSSQLCSTHPLHHLHAQFLPLFPLRPPPPRLTLQRMDGVAASYTALARTGCF